MAYLGAGNVEEITRFRKEDEYTGNGSSTDFTLSQSVGGGFATNVIVSLDGLVQNPYDDYNIIGTDWKTIRFTSAPALNKKIVVIHLGETTLLVSPAADSVTYETLAADLKSFTIDSFTGDGIASGFTLSRSIATPNTLLVSVDGVIQQPGINYNAVNSSLIFTGVPDSGAKISALHLGIATAVSYPIQGSISPESLNPIIRIVQNTNLTGDGVTSTFTMIQSEASANTLIVSIEGIVQTPDIHYSVSGNQITFNGVPALGAAINIRHLNVSVLSYGDAIPVVGGGTGASTALQARANLGAAPATHVTDYNNPHNVTSTQILPSQSGANGKFLTSNGTTVSWGTALAASDIGSTVQGILTSGTNIKTVNSTSLLGSGNLVVSEVPSQSGANGKFLTSNGTSASWSTLPWLILNRDNNRLVTANTATTNISLSTGDEATFFKVTISANTTITFQNLPTASNNEVFNFNMMSVNGAASGSNGISWGNTIKWAGGIVPPKTTTLNAIDVWTFFYENGVIYGSLAVADAK